MSQPMKIHARTMYCPLCEKTGAYNRLTKVNLSETHARKGCKACKRKFDYIRSDTYEGRRERTRQRDRELRADYLRRHPEEAEKLNQPKQPAKTNAERQREWRDRKREKLARETASESQGVVIPERSDFMPHLLAGSVEDL